MYDVLTEGRLLVFAIRKMRERAKLSQQEAADSLSITLRRYGNWEREDREINLRDAIRLADLFGCTLDELAGRPWPTEGLSPDERDLVEAYRSADERGQGNILDTASREKSASAGDVVPARRSVGA